QQKGSLVDPDKLRFDFSHNKALGEDEIARVETLVDERVRQQLPVYAENAPQEQALKIHGLRAVFGEKYPPMVRVVSIGVPVTESQLPQAITALQKQLGAAENLPLRAKRRAQAAVTELQAKQKAWEKSQRASTGAGIDAVAIASNLLAQATPVGEGKLIVGE